MRMMVRCGNEDCENVFYVDSMDPRWDCTKCGREIINRNYPFLTAKLMQAKIDGEKADWKSLFIELLERSENEIRTRGGMDRIDTDFMKKARDLLNGSKDLTNVQWRERHDKLLEEARKAVLSLEGDQ
jgi:hypothetical protein